MLAVKSTTCTCCALFPAHAPKNSYMYNTDAEAVHPILEACKNFTGAPGNDKNTRLLEIGKI